MTTGPVNDPNRPEHRLPTDLGVLDMNAGPARRGAVIDGGNRMRPLPRGEPVRPPAAPDVVEEKGADAQTPSDRGERRRRSQPRPIPVL